MRVTLELRVLNEVINCQWWYCCYYFNYFQIIQKLESGYLQLQFTDQKVLLRDFNSLLFLKLEMVVECLLEKFYVYMVLLDSKNRKKSYKDDFILFLYFIF